MKTLILDIDGTLTNLWPIEKTVLLAMLGGGYTDVLEDLYRSGTKDTHTLFCRVSQQKTSKTVYYTRYNQTFISLERAKALPVPEAYPLVEIIKQDGQKYHFVYATGGQAQETRYVLTSLGIETLFDFKNSLDKSCYHFSKSTGLPFRKIRTSFPDCFLISDSQKDCQGAVKAEIPYLRIQPGEAVLKLP